MPFHLNNIQFIMNGCKQIAINQKTTVKLSCMVWQILLFMPKTCKIGGFYYVWTP